MPHKQIVLFVYTNYPGESVIFFFSLFFFFFFFQSNRIVYVLLSQYYTCGIVPDKRLKFLLPAIKAEKLKAKKTREVQRSMSSLVLRSAWYDLPTGLRV